MLRQQLWETLEALSQVCDVAEPDGTSVFVAVTVAVSSDLKSSHRPHMLAYGQDRATLSHEGGVRGAFRIERQSSSERDGQSQEAEAKIS